jgi:hypothetical protein
MLCYAPTTVDHHLSASFQFVSKHLERASHDLTITQKVFREEKLDEPFRLKKLVRHKEVILLATSDQCQFYFVHDFEPPWFPCEEAPGAWM